MAIETPKVIFNFIKSQFFRVISADGAFGGFTPTGKIFLSFYTERLPIPKHVAYHVDPEGNIGDEIIEERNSKKEIVRELEIGVTLDIKTAASLVVWLQEKIKSAESARAGDLKAVSEA